MIILTASYIPVFERTNLAVHFTLQLWDIENETQIKSIVIIKVAMEITDL